LLKGSGNFPVRDHFRLGFGEATGLGVKAQQVGRVKTGGSQNSGDGRRHHIESGESLATGSQVLRRQ
jgi:hypothetical protein